MTRDDVSECFDPGFQTICHHTLIALSDWMSTSAAAVALQSGSSRRARAVAVIFSLGQHGPNDPSGFGGKRHHGDLVGPTCEQFAQPGIADAVPLLLAQMGAGAVDQQRTQGAVSLFGDAARTMLAAGAVIVTVGPLRRSSESALPASEPVDETPPRWPRRNLLAIPPL